MAVILNSVFTKPVLPTPQVNSHIPSREWHVLDEGLSPMNAMCERDTPS